MNLHIFAVIVLAILVFCYAQNDGWKMTDRFYGFRYELQGKGLGTAMQQQIQNQADINGCFGWVQISKYSDSLVGEARCSKGRGPAFKEWISTLTNVDKADTLVYEDTKIRLHFSHFKILDTSRETCFLDKPHQCPEFKNNGEAEGQSTGSGRTEL